MPVEMIATCACVWVSDRLIRVQSSSAFCKISNNLQQPLLAIGTADNMDVAEVKREFIILSYI